jgi:hypothetical protein
MISSYLLIFSNHLNLRLPYQVERYQFLDADDKLKRVLNQLEISKLYWRINYSIEKADPEEYKKKHGNSLIPTAQLPDFIKQLDKKSGYDKYINEMRNKKDLIGDLKALQYVDLKSHGLELYNKYLNNV